MLKEDEKPVGKSSKFIFEDLPVNKKLVLPGTYENNIKWLVKSRDMWLE